MFLLVCRDTDSEISIILSCGEWEWFWSSVRREENVTQLGLDQDLISRGEETLWWTLDLDNIAFIFRSDEQLISSRRTCPDAQRCRGRSNHASRDGYHQLWTEVNSYGLGFYASFVDWTQSIDRSTNCFLRFISLSRIHNWCSGRSEAFLHPCGKKTSGTRWYQTGLSKLGRRTLHNAFERGKQRSHSICDLEGNIFFFFPCLSRP